MSKNEMSRARHPGIILRVHPESLAEELELIPGDKIVAINGEEVRDIIELSFAMADEEIELLMASGAAPITATSASWTWWRPICEAACP